MSKNIRFPGIKIPGMEEAALIANELSQEYKKMSELLKKLEIKEHNLNIEINKFNIQINTDGLNEELEEKIEISKEILDTQMNINKKNNKLTDKFREMRFRKKKGE